jgi:hypothetical protein
MARIDSGTKSEHRIHRASADLKLVAGSVKKYYVK